MGRDVIQFEKRTSAIVSVKHNQTGWGGFIFKARCKVHSISSKVEERMFYIRFAPEVVTYRILCKREAEEHFTVVNKKHFTSEDLYYQILDEYPGSDDTSIIKNSYQMTSSQGLIPLGAILTLDNPKQLQDG